MEIIREMFFISIWALALVIVLYIIGSLIFGFFHTKELNDLKVKLEKENLISLHEEMKKMQLEMSQEVIKEQFEILKESFKSQKKE